MNGLISLGVIVVYLLICLAFGLIRGLGKTRIRCITIILSAVGAFFATMWLKTSTIIQENLNPILQGNGETLDELAKMLEDSPTLYDALVGCVTSLAAPFLFLVLFIALCIVTWVIYFIVTLILHRAIKAANKKSHFRLLRTVLLSVVLGLVVIFVYFIPVYTLESVAPTLIDSIEEAGLTEELLSGADVEGAMDEYVAPEAEGPAFKALEAIGGKAISEKLTDFKVGEDTIHLNDELGAISSFGLKVYKLSQTEMANYGPAEAKLILALADSFGDSALLPTIAGELIYNATDAWLKDQAFLGVAMPETNELIEPLLKTMMGVLHDDARDLDRLSADFHTIADIVSIFAEKGVFAKLDDMNNLVKQIGSDGTVKALIDKIGQNEGMKVLIPEITNMGMRAIASSMNIPADGAEVYGEFMGDIADALKETAGMSEEERVEALTGKVTDAFKDAGIEIDEDIIGCYSASLLNDLGDLTEVTAEDIQDFFLLYAMNMMDEGEGAPSGDDTDPVAFFIPLADEQPVFSGKIYGSMTDEQLAKTGAAVLANVTRELASIEESDPAAVAEKAAKILADNYTGLLGEGSKALDKIKTIEITEKLSDKVVSATKSLKSPDTIETKVVTLQDLLVDTAEAAKNITPEAIAKEAEAIDKIFSNAAGLVDGSASLDNLESVAGVVGNILDALNTSSSFGEEKTANLFTAVLQSETVRASAGLDMESATALAKAATKSEDGTPVNYGATMSCVSNAVTVVSSLGSGEIASTDDIVKLIADMNPQTAGMIREYVTEERMREFGLGDKAGTTSGMLVNLFDYMAKDLPEEKYESESKAIQQMLNIAIGAKDNASGKKVLFGGEESILGVTAIDLVTTVLDSDAVCYALEKTMIPEGSTAITPDPFGIGSKIHAESSDETAFRNAISAYKLSHEASDTLTKRVNLVFAMFGLEEN